MVDLQVNGYAGIDFNSRPNTWSPEMFFTVQGALQRRGVVMALPTLITDDSERMIGRATAYARILREAPELASTFPKLHLEGPFISAQEGPRGAHPLAHCRTPQALPDLVDRLREASGDRIGILSLAPELPGALDLIARASEQGICVGLAHTQAAAELIREAVAAGAKMSTHLGNASHQMLPRLANYVQVQLAEDGLFASFIADGHHIPWYTLKNFIRAKTVERSILVTDAVAAAEVGAGRYTLGGEEVLVSPDLRVQKPGQPNLAGSALTLDRAVVNVTLNCGIPFQQACEMAGTRPAALLGLPAPRRIATEVSWNGFAVVPEGVFST